MATPPAGRPIAPLRAFARAAVLLLATAITAAVPAGGATAEEFIAGTVSKVGDEAADLPYRLFVPRGQAAGLAYPVIIFLHGSGEMGTDNAKQLSDAANGAMELVSAANQAAHPCVLVAPQCQKSWNDDTFAQIVRLLDELAARCAIDRDRIVITGVSLGGAGTWSFASRYPDLFSAAVPMSGFDDGAVDAAAIEIPIWVFHAMDDHAVPYFMADDLVSALRVRNRPVIYTRYACGGHVIWPTAYANPHLLPWMMAQKRGHAPTGTPLVMVTRRAGPAGAMPASTVSVSGTASMPAGVTSVHWHLAGTSLTARPYDAAASYPAGALVAYAGSNYRAAVASTGILPGSGRRYWYRLSGPEDPGLTDPSVDPTASGTGIWSVTDAMAMPPAPTLFIAIASGSSCANLGGSTTVNDGVWIGGETWK
jgi:poly(3-hydroxybutyrate) depolymerase